MNFLNKSPKLLGIILSFFILIIYFFSTNLTSGDSKWTLFSATSIINEGNADLNEYQLLFTEADTQIEKINNHYYNYFPIGPTLLSVPLILGADILGQTTIFQTSYKNLFHKDLPVNFILHYYSRFEMYFASIITALSALFLFLWIQSISTPVTALLLTIIFAFGTSTWSTASRAMWQHGPSLLFITLSLYLLEIAKKKQYFLYLAGCALALTYIMRPTNSLIIVGLSVYVLYTYKKDALRFFAGTLPITIGFLIYNFSKYNNYLSPYYLPNRLGFGPHFLEAIAGNLVSPARGLFIFSPILLFSLYGIYIKIKEKTWNFFDTVCLGIIILHWISISSFNHWWGGFSFGPRFFTEMIPFFIYFLIPVIKQISSMTKIKKIIFTTCFAILLTTSILIHGIGANIWSTCLWNSTPINIDEAPERIWDWSDLQFLRW